MAERLVFLTGHLARARLEKLLAGLGETDFSWEIVDIGVKVAALMTRGHHQAPAEAAGRHRPRHPARPLSRRSRPAVGAFRRAFRARPRRDRRPAGLSRPRPASRRTCRATTCASSPRSSMRRCCRSRACWRGRASWSDAGADVIDLGCLPETPFPLLGEAVRELKAEGFCVSVDSASTDELLTGAQAGRRLSAQPRTRTRCRWRFDHGATPVLIPSVPGDLDSLGRAIEQAQTGRHRLHRRSGARSDPFRLRRLARPLHRGAPPLAGDRAADGHRQPDRTDRRRQFRHHGDAGRALLRTAGPQRACRPCQPAHGAHRRGARRSRAA